VTGTITPAVLKSFYNINGVGSSAATQGVYETLTQYYSPKDLAQFQNAYKLSTAGPVISIGNHASSQHCIDTPNDCLEGNHYIYIHLYLYISIYVCTYIIYENMLIYIYLCIHYLIMYT
jgi:hypothetical protein